MKYGFVRAALISPKIQPGAVDSNKAELIKAIRSAAEKGAEIIATGRLSLSGYSLQSMFLYSNLLQGCIDKLASLVSETQSLNNLVIVGLPMKMQGKIYDCSAVISGGKVLAFVPHKNSDPVFSDYPEGELTYIKMDGTDVPFGKDIVLYNNLLDYSIKFSDSASYLPKTEIVLRPLSSVKTMGSRQIELDACKAYSIENSCAILSVSAEQQGMAGQKIYDSFRFMQELGQDIVKADISSTLTVSEIDITAISQAQSHLKDDAAFADNYVTVEFNCNNNDSILNREVSKFPLCPASTDECEDIIEILTTSIREKLKEAKQQKVIFGFSGGLDSTNVLMLCYKLFEREGIPLSNIIAVTMPSSHSSKNGIKHAKKLIDYLGITNINHPISTNVKKHLKMLEHTEHDVVYENAQARFRAQILLNLANKYDALLLGTSDLSELCLGFATYGGDLTAHYNPNGGLTKTAMKFIIKYTAETLSFKEVGRTLRDILKSPISPELKKNQETEKILGPYDLHDFFLSCLVLKGYDVEKTLFMAERAFREKQRKDIVNTLKIFIDRFFKYRFKQNYSCESPAVLSEQLSDILQAIRSGVSGEQWLKELANLKV